MSVTATGPTLGTLSGTPVLFFPVPTPWPSSAGCDRYIYRQVGEGSILAWDPVYTRGIGTGAESCFLPQQASWWLQDGSANPSTALGPTFVCPMAYSAVHSTVLDSNSVVETQFTYCCPPKFSLGAILPQNQRSVIQCTSTARLGATISFLSVTFLTTTLTLINDDGNPTRQFNTRSTNLPTSTVVQVSAATVYAPPVNGFNLVQQRQVSESSRGATASSNAGTSPSGSTPPAWTSDASTQSSGLAPGAIAGVAVGAGFGLLLLALGVFFLWRRRQQPAAAGERIIDYYDGTTQGGAAVEMPVKQEAQEMPHGEHAYELPDGRYAHELPNHR